MSSNEEDVIRARDLPRTESSRVQLLGDRTPVTNERLTEVGAGGVRVEGTNAKRTIPTPWVDCDVCDRRHYPSTIAGRWHIATDCLSCGAVLPGG